MDRHQVKKAYVALPAPSQIALLARLAHELTVCARDTYVAGTDDVRDPTRLRAFNECQHRVVGHLNHLLNGAVERYPDDHMGEWLALAAKELGFERTLTRLLEAAVTPAGAANAEVA